MPKHTKSDFLGNPSFSAIRGHTFRCRGLCESGTGAQGYIPEYSDVAIKIQRPNLTELVTTDMSMVLQGAKWLQDNWGISSGKPTDAVVFKTDILLR